jgi:OOP family OmpA-OmpF porin
MKKHALLVLIILFRFTSFAQFNVLDKVKNKASQRADQKVDQAIDKGLDKTEEGVKSDKDNSTNSNTPNPKSESKNNLPDKKEDLAVYGKYDFVPGTKIIFEDDVTGESIGEFPSKWNLAKGKIEVASLNGEKVIAFLEGNYAGIYPFWKDKSDYLPDVFSIEFDHYVKPGGYNTMQVNLHTSEAGADFVDNDVFTSDISTGQNAAIGSAAGTYPEENYEGRWHHVAIAYNKGNVKIYTDQYRLCIAPHLEGNPYSFYMGCIGDGTNTIIYVKNVRIAEGGGDLYKRVMSDGKIISRGILFDVNKATLKPQSMGPINELVQLMKDHSDLKFEIDGHTDADGDDAANLKLSQQRAETVKAQLISSGIDASRLTSKGYGETKPVDNNSTSEGKANNRRVEFVKM